MLNGLPAGIALGFCAYDRRDPIESYDDFGVTDWYREPDDVGVCDDDEVESLYDCLPRVGLEAYLLSWWRAIATQLQWISQEDDEDRSSFWEFFVYLYVKGLVICSETCQP